MDRCKEFFSSITKTGWIVFSSAIVLILLVIIGILLARKGVDLWPFNNGSDNLQASEVIENEELMANVDRAMQSAKDSVLSVEDVLDGKYGNSVESATLFVQNTTEVKVALLIDTEASGIEGDISTTCGDFTFVTTRVPDKPGIINETLTAVFADKVASDFMPGNVLSKFNSNLIFENAVLEEGVAKIYVRGEFGDTDCAKENAITSIVQTVSQFRTVNEVEIYQNLQKVN